MTNHELENESQDIGIPLVGEFSKDRLPLHVYPGGYVINLQDHKAGEGTHWVALVVGKKSTTYFDAFGFPPPQDVIHFIQNHVPIEWSGQQIQSIQSGVCGSYCLAFLYYVLLRKGSLRGFLRLFSTDPPDNLKKLTALLLSTPLRLLQAVSALAWMGVGVLQVLIQSLARRGVGWGDVDRNAASCKFPSSANCSTLNSTLVMRRSSFSFSVPPASSDCATQSGHLVCRQWRRDLG